MHRHLNSLIAVFLLLFRFLLFSFFIPSSTQASRSGKVAVYSRRSHIPSSFLHVVVTLSLCLSLCMLCVCYLYAVSVCCLIRLPKALMCPLPTPAHLKLASFISISFVLFCSCSVSLTVFISHFRRSFADV